MFKRLKEMVISDKVWFCAFILAFIIRVAISIPLSHDWDSYVFQTSAEQLLEGTTPYEVVAQNNPEIYPDSDRAMTQQWYGYPPLPLLMFTTPLYIAKLAHIQLTPPLTNALIKLPFIIGDLVCAYLVYRFLRKEDEKKGRIASLLILFNPVFIWISAAWGMFDVWLLNFLLLFLLSIRIRADGLAGLALALAVQIKLFAVFFLPAIAFYLLQKNLPKRGIVILLGLFTLVTLLIDTPFFVISPQGFMNQNLLMHLARPPQGIGIVGAADYISRVYGISIDLFAKIANLITIAFVSLFSLTSIWYTKGKEKRLLEVLLLTYSALLVFNKVVNEQYFVVFIGLVLLLAFLKKEKTDIISKKILKFLEGISTMTILFVSVVLGFHFLTFLPPFIAVDILKTSTNYLVYNLSALFSFLPKYTYPDSLWTYYNIPVTLSYLLILPLLVSIIAMMGKSLVNVVSLWKKEPIISPSFSLKTSTLLGVVLFSLVIFVCVSTVQKPVRAYLSETKALELIDLPKETHATFPETPRIGTFYNVWWNNPSHLPNTADDAWKKTSLTPLAGFYTSKNSYFVEHIQQMKETGIDFAVISYHLYDRQRYLTFSQYADSFGLYHTPLIESSDALLDTKDHAVSPFGQETPGFAINTYSRKDMVNTIISSLADLKNSPGVLKQDGKPVVYIYDGHFFFPSWDDDSKKLLAEKVVKKYATNSTDPYVAISRSWKTKVTNLSDVIAQYPTDVQSFNNTNKQTAKKSNDDFKGAFIESYQDYWKDVRTDVEKKVGPVYLISTYPSPLPEYGNTLFKPEDIVALHIFDNEFYYSLSNTWSFWRDIKPAQKVMDVWGKQVDDQTKRDQKASNPVILTVNPAYDDTVVRGKLGFSIPQTLNNQSTYDITWKDAIRNKPDYILIASWNEFFEGSAIEPSVEYKDTLLTRTKAWIQKYKKDLLESK